MTMRQHRHGRAVLLLLDQDRLLWNTAFVSTRQLRYRYLKRKIVGLEVEIRDWLHFVLSSHSPQPQGLAKEASLYSSDTIDLLQSLEYAKAQSIMEAQLRTQTSPAPRLYNNLKLALASLYSLPNANANAQSCSKQETHDFLMNLQSRNVRRKLQSIRQQSCDATQGSKSVQTIETVQMGSSWLAVVAILLSGDSHETERLFCAQTILHRLRRVKISEAIDLETELWSDTNNKNKLLHYYESTDHVLHMAASYIVWVRSINPFVASVLEAAAIQPSGSEEQIKGTITIFTLSAIAYEMSKHSAVGVPLLSTTLSALATTIFRVRYTIPLQSQNPPSLVGLLRQSFFVVEQVSLDSTDLPALLKAVLCGVAAIPDTVLGSSGGTRGRISVDPIAIQTASHDLRRVDSALALQVLMQAVASGTVDLWVLQCVARWASFLPLNMSMLQQVIPLANRYLELRDSPEEKCAYELLIAIYDGASWTVDQILSSSMGLADTQLTQQHAKKRQSSRSKKRHQEAVDRRTTDSALHEAQIEMKLRGEIACQATVYCWLSMRIRVLAALEDAASNKSLQINGEGPVGCLASCANACLPHLLRNPAFPQGQELFLGLTELLQTICASPNKSVRYLAMEPLYTLHKVVLVLTRTSNPFDSITEGLLADHFFKCAMNIASVCGYPDHYFDCLSAESNHELEIERNDVRDLLRTLAGSGEGGSTVAPDSSSNPIGVATLILSKLINACQEAIATLKRNNFVSLEAAIHAFSSLAKPVNYISSSYVRNVGNCQNKQTLLLGVLRVIHNVNRIAIDSFTDNEPITYVLPLSRIVNILNASFAPFFSALLSMNDDCIKSDMAEVLNKIILGSILSLEQLPELCAPSILETSMYDIIGTMRGPGGEDHVGCLTLMRLSSDSDILTGMVVAAAKPFISRICDLHQQLKNVEIERGQDVVHGVGVTPQTRRILLGSLSNLEILSQGQLGAAALLSHLFSSAINSIAFFKSDSTISETMLYRLTETTLDLASFSPSIVATLFDVGANAVDEEQNRACLEVLTSAISYGYQHLLPGNESLIFHWNRLRAAIFVLTAKSSKSGDIAKCAATVLLACITSECNAITTQCARGATSISGIFTDEFVSADSVPAGLFVRSVAEILQCCRGNREAISARPNCILVLKESKDIVLDTITSPCSESRGFTDPRPTLAEAWFQAMIALVEETTVEASAEPLVVDSFVVAVTLLYMPTMRRTQHLRMEASGLSLDGPQSLALTSFLAAFFRLGPAALKAVTPRLLETIPVDIASIERYSTDSNFWGLSIIGAALFRACQGSLPPWAIESIPEVYSSLFAALGSDADTFGAMMRLSIEVRLAVHADGFGGVDSGKLMSGRFFESMSEKAKTQFMDEAKQLCRKGGDASWRRLKVVIKQACGGKKKATDFGQKPPCTRWQFDRV